MNVIEVLAKCKVALEHVTYKVQYQVAEEKAVDAISSIDAMPTTIGQISDGYHTFDELYEHRIELWIKLCHGSYGAWRTQTHSDGSCWEGWFVLGLGREQGKQITYHLPMSRWGDCAWADTLEIAPEFDGHTSADVLERLKGL